MKKLLATCALCLCFTSTSQAATLGFELGANLWNTNNTIGQKNTPDTKTKSDYAASVYGVFEHPIPFLPNVRAEYLRNENDVRSNKNKSDTSYADITLYYQVLDNWVNLDLGVSARKMDAEYKIANNVTAGDSNTLGALYAKLQFDLPVTGLSVGAAAQNDAGLNGDRSIQDYSAYVQYKIAIGFGIGAGYRLQDYTLKYNHNIGEFDHKIKGAYLNAFWQF